MPSLKDIQKLSSFIEENTRASETSGITYIDPRNFKERILLKQNHVIFGRRGAGKSSLIKTLKESNAKSYHYSYINIEDIKDVSFPNILIHVLDKFNSEISTQIKKDVRFWHFRRKSKASNLCVSINNAIQAFRKEISNPDMYDIDQKEKNTQGTKMGGGLKTEMISATGEISEGREVEQARKVQINKLDILKNSIPALKSIIKEISSFSNKPIFLIFDDFYFLNKDIQVFFIDFFHRLSKDTNLFIKVATIRHRSKLYSQFHGAPFGTEIGHDILEIDLDYNLDRFDELRSFMRSLIDECARLSGVSFQLDDIFSTGAFTQLCLASGGVPRDFLTLFVKVSNNYNEAGNRKISKTNITEAAINNMSNKNSFLKTDSAEEKEILEQYLSYLKDKIIVEKKTNMLLVSNNDINQYGQIKQALKELVDLRMLHLVDPNTSASGGTAGLRYTAYMVDIGLYPNAMQYGFKQLDPGVTDDAGRKDEMRGAPKINLSEYDTFITSKNLARLLQITDD